MRVRSPFWRSLFREEHCSIPSIASWTRRSQLFRQSDTTTTEIRMIRSYARYLVLIILLAGCATTAPQPGETEVRFGTISRIEAVSLEGDSQLGLGSIIG